ncbi:MAG: long-chain-fatty-acid--CoA ligase [Desulfobacteraceae bacterium]|nr:long-chain-fatty-acid--CoA ligase [Desulfobacteraceae bacterium]
MTIRKTTCPEFSTRYPLLVKNLMNTPLYMYPDDIAMVFRSSEGDYFRLTWRQWHERTCRLANALKALNVKTGDRVAAMCLNHHWHMESIYATICTGAISHPINVRLAPDHIAYTITHAEDKIIFVDRDVLPLAEAVYDRIRDNVEAFIYMSDKKELPETKIRPLYAYEDLIADQPKTFDWPDLDEDTHAVLYYTTGTTGLPKGALYTHRQIYLHSLHLTMTVNTAPRLPDDPPRPNQPVPMMNIPLFHIHAWGSPFFNVLMCSKIVLPGRFTPEGFCELVQTEKVNSTMLVPTMLAMLLEYEKIDDWDLSSLTYVNIGAGALPLGLKQKAEKRFPYMRVGSGYGMTETYDGVIRAAIKRDMAELPREEIDQVMVKTGLAFVPAIDVRVVDEQGCDVPKDNDTIGEIVLRGHWIMEHYYKDPDRTAEAWRDGWFHTGDAARIDSEGYITIVDRITDVIRSGSEMIPTVLLENLTSNADFVLEAMYVGVPDEKWGELPMAIVRLMPGMEATEKDVIEFLNWQGVATGKLAKWMLPVYVAIVDEIPKTSVGKHNKKEVRKKIDSFLAAAKKMQ